MLANNADNVGIFQSSGRAGDALRLVVEPPNRLVLVLFGIDAVPITLSEAFTLRHWHHVVLRGVRNGAFDVTVDGSKNHFRDVFD